MPHYYELNGKSRRKVLDVLDERQRVHREIIAWVKSHGATRYVHQLSRVVGADFNGKAVVSEKCWRPHYDKSSRQHDDWHVPNRSTKEGKAIYREMMKFYLPGSQTIADAVGLEVMHGLTYTTPGVRIWGSHTRRRVFLITSDEIPPPKTTGCTRISDLRFEELERKYEKPSRKKASNKRT